MRFRSINNLVSKNTNLKLNNKLQKYVLITHTNTIMYILYKSKLAKLTKNQWLFGEFR